MVAEKKLITKKKAKRRRKKKEKSWIAKRRPTGLWVMAFVFSAMGILLMGLGLSPGPVPQPTRAHISAASKSHTSALSRTTVEQKKPPLSQKHSSAPINQNAESAKKATQDVGVLAKIGFLAIGILVFSGIGGPSIPGLFGLVRDMNRWIAEGALLSSRLKSQKDVERARVQTEYVTKMLAVSTTSPRAKSKTPNTVWARIWASVGGVAAATIGHFIFPNGTTRGFSLSPFDAALFFWLVIAVPLALGFFLSAYTGKFTREIMELGLRRNLARNDEYIRYDVIPPCDRRWIRNALSRWFRRKRRWIRNRRPTHRVAPDSQVGENQ